MSLRRFLRPFADALDHKQRRRWCPLYLRGLLAPLERKSVQPIAALVAPRQYAQLHHFVTTSPWRDATCRPCSVAGHKDWLVVGRLG